jgi:hypothetical protein
MDNPLRLLLYYKNRLNRNEETLIKYSILQKKLTMVDIEYLNFLENIPNGDNRKEKFQKY